MKEQKSSHPPPRMKWWDLIKIALALGFLGYVVSNTDLSQLLSLSYRISLEWFGITFILFCIMTILKAAQYHFLIGRKLSYPRVLGIVVLQNAITNFVAAAAGVASQLALISAEKDIKFSRAAFSFLIAKLGDLIAVAILLLLSSFWVWPRARSLHGVVIAVLVLTVLIVVFFTVALLMRGHFINLVKKVIYFLKADRFNLVQRGMALLENIAVQDRNRILGLVLYGTGYSVIYMIATMAWGYARFRMFSMSLEMDVITFVVSLLQYASWVPVYMFGGLGISETLSVFLFGVFGVNKPEVAAILIGARLVFYLMNAVSLLYLPLNTLPKRDWEDS